MQFLEMGGGSIGGISEPESALVGSFWCHCGVGCAHSLWKLGAFNGEGDRFRVSPDDSGEVTQPH